MPKYKKNYLSEVVLRIDFKNPFPEYAQTFPNGLEEIIMRHFTLKDVKNAITEEFTFQPASGQVNRNKSEFKEWNFYGNEKLKRLCITKNFFYISYKKYISYEDFLIPFMSVVNYLKTKSPDHLSTRIGMRYINIIRFNEGNPFSWEKYIQSNLLSIFEVPGEKSKISRALNLIELNMEDIKIKYQYGMNNPDYPAPIKQRQFVLDCDASKSGQLTFGEIEHIIPILHEKIENLFENSITEDFRSLLNE